MSEINISKRSKEDQDRIAVDLAASGVAYKERLNQPIVPEIVAREQPRSFVNISWKGCANIVS